MDLPEPGGPIISRLWPPAAAISSARLAVSMPRTSAMSATAGASAMPPGSGGDSSWLPRKWLTSDSRSGAASTEMRPAQAASPPCAAGTDQPEIGAGRSDGGGQHAGDRVQPAIEREFAQRGVLGQVVVADDVHCGQHGQGDRQVEMAAFLQQVGRREIDQHPARRQRQAHRGEGGAHPLARLAHRLVGQAHDQKSGQAGGDLHLHLHRHRLDAGEGEALDAGDGHGAP